MLGGSTGESDATGMIRSIGLFVTYEKTKTEHDRTSYIIWLVVWNLFYFPCHIWDVILPIDFHMFQDG